MNEQELIDYTLSLIPQEEKERVFNEKHCYIGGDFIGFISTYYHLSQIVPKECTIYDFGCAYNSQCYFFLNHAKYIAINPVEQDAIEKFKSPNCDLYSMTTKEFIDEHYKPTEHDFAICNFVPNWYGQNSMDLVHHNFQNCYTFYPCKL